jgi:hypothetical protein
MNQMYRDPDIPDEEFRDNEMKKMPGDELVSSVTSSTYISPNQ